MNLKDKLILVANTCTFFIHIFPWKFWKLLVYNAAWPCFWGIHFFLDVFVQCGYGKAYPIYEYNLAEGTCIESPKFSFCISLPMKLLPLNRNLGIPSHSTVGSAMPLFLRTQFCLAWFFFTRESYDMSSLWFIYRIFAFRISVMVISGISEWIRHPLRSGIYFLCVSRVWELSDCVLVWSFEVY